MSRWRPQTVSERLDLGAAPPDSNGCVLWTKAIADTGYGVMNVGGKIVGVHRLAYERTSGPIPQGMFVLHSCDVRACINPAHLRVGSNAENVAEMVAKRRHLFGNAHPNAKISDDEARAAVRLAMAGLQQKEVAAMFGISRPHVSQMCSGKKRQHALAGAQA